MEAVKEKKNRKVRAQWRYKEDGTYYRGPLNAKEYYNTYYHKRCRSKYMSVL